MSNLSPLSVSEEQAIDERVDRVRRAVRAGRPERRVSPVVDPYDVRESTRDQLEGAHEKRPEVWRQVMEAHDFVWFSAERMNHVFGPLKVIPRTLAGLVDPRTGGAFENAHLYQIKPHEEGQWRRDHPRRWGFTIADLCSEFGSPEAFDRWIRAYEARLSLARRGIVVTR